MSRIVIFAVIVALFSLGDAYSKYGRTCKDIECSRTEKCIIQEDKCTPYTRNNNCGKFPTCKKISKAVQTCSNYVCPPTKMCRVDRGEPKCVDDPSPAINRKNKKTVQSYNPGAPGGDNSSASNYPPQVNYSRNPGQNPNYPQNSGYNPNYPQNQTKIARRNVYQPGKNASGGGYQGGAVRSGQGSGYPPQVNYSRNPGQNPNYPQNPGYNPNYPQNQTKIARPNVYQPGKNASGGGYQGGAVRYGQGSGYSPQVNYSRNPGQNPNYPQNPGYNPNYPQNQIKTARPNASQPGKNASGGGYQGGAVRSGQGSGYPAQGGAYPGQTGQQYPGQPGYNTQQGGGYPRQGSGYYNQNQGGQRYGPNSATTVLEKITDTLKTLGLFWFLVKFMVSRFHGIYS